MQQKHPIHIVLLGGGYVSVFAYKQLVRRLRKEVRGGAVKLTVVCPLEHHIYHGWTSEVLTGILPVSAQESALREVMPLAEIWRGVVEAIDLVQQRVSVRLLHNGSVHAIAYDHLVIGTGSVDNDTPKEARTFGYQVKCRASFQHTRRALHHQIALAATHSPQTAQRLLRFAVAGSGLTGVELVANLAEYVYEVKKQFPALREVQPTFYLISSSERILPELQGKFESLIRYTERTLGQYGVRMVYGRLKEIVPEGGVLSDGTLLESSVVITALGQRRIPIAGTEDLQRDKYGRIVLDRKLRVKGQLSVWGGGDACSATHPVYGTPCISNALWAIKQGEHLGRNVARVIQGKRAWAFWYPGLGQAASLGIGKGIVEIYKIPLTGVTAWLMRWFFFHYFLWKISPRSAKESLKGWYRLFSSGKRMPILDNTSAVEAQDYCEEGKIQPHALEAERSPAPAPLLTR